MINVLLRSDSGRFVTVNSDGIFWINGDLCLFVPELDFDNFSEWAKLDSIAFYDLKNIRSKQTHGIAIKSGINYFLIKNDSKA